MASGIGGDGDGSLLPGMGDGGAGDPLPPDAAPNQTTGTNPPTPSDVVHSISTQLDGVLASTDSLSASSAQEVTQFVSWLIATQQEATQSHTNTSGAHDDDDDHRQSIAAADAIGNAVIQLGRAAASSGGHVSLSSPLLNLSASSISPSSLVEASDGGALASPSFAIAVPVAVGGGSGKLDTPTAAPPAAKVALPLSILVGAAGGALGINTSLPVALTLAASSVNLYGGAPHESGTTIAASSPLVSFALLQGNREVTVRDTAEPINLTIPLVRRGMESRRGASTRLECRWWDSGGREWSANGCTTLEGEGGRSAICSCNHLTQFVVFEFPTSWQELGEHLSAALSINPLTVEAWQCLVTPSPWHAPTDGYTGATWTSIPGVWMVNAGLLLLAMTSLTCAARRDKDELEWIQALVAGRMRAERRSSVGRRTSLLRRHGAHVLTRTRSTRPSRPSFCELAAAATSVPQTRTAMGRRRRWVVRVLARSGSRLDGAAALAPPPPGRFALEPDALRTGACASDRSSSRGDCGHRRQGCALLRRSGLTRHS